MSGVTLSYRIDVEGLLAPISSERPAGESLRHEGTYDRINAARREDDPAESRGIYQTHLKRADWEAAEEICLHALETRTKDLQISGWLLEAWLHLHGLSGVAAGVQLMTGLCEKFWDDLYPLLSEGEAEDRIAPLEWINQKLSLKLKLIPLTVPIEAGEKGYTLADWELACHLEHLARKDPDVSPEALANIKPSVASFRIAVASTDDTFYVALAQDLAGAIDASAALQQLFDEKCGKQSPSLHQFREVLGNIQQLLSQSQIAQERGMAVVDKTTDRQIETKPSEPDHQVWPSDGPIVSRADAYHRLAEAADYLLRTEPHSPTPYLVRRAVEWGNMSLGEVYQQIVRNEGEMEEIDRLLGLSGKKLAEPH